MKSLREMFVHQLYCNLLQYCTLFKLAFTSGDVVCVLTKSFQKQQIMAPLVPTANEFYTLAPRCHGV